MRERNRERARGRYGNRESSPRVVFLLMRLLHLGTGGRGGAPLSFLPEPKRSKQRSYFIWIHQVSPYSWMNSKGYHLCRRRQSCRSCWGKSSGSARRARAEEGRTAGGSWIEIPTHLLTERRGGEWKSSCFSLKYIFKKKILFWQIFDRKQHSSSIVTSVIYKYWPPRSGLRSKELMQRYVFRHMDDPRCDLLHTDRSVIFLCCYSLNAPSHPSHHL